MLSPASGARLLMQVVDYEIGLPAASLPCNVALTAVVHT
jgi:hypothetical protein